MASADEHLNMAIHHLDVAIRSGSPEDFANQTLLSDSHALIALSAAVIEIREHLYRQAANK